MTPQTPAIDPNLMYNDPAAYTAAVIAAARAEARQEFQAETQSAVAPLASMARNQAMTFRPEVWARYGPEIDALMADVNANARLNVDLWKRAVNMVAGEHVDEIAREKAEALIRSGDVGTMPTNGSAPLGSGSPSSASPIRALFASNDPAIQAHKEADLTADDVIAYYAKMGKDETRAAETLKNAASRRVKVGA